MQRIIGIDPGLTRCGVGVISLLPGRKLVFEHVEVLKSSPDMELSERIHTIGSSISRLLDGAFEGDNPTEIALERVFAESNVKSVMGVAQLSGVAMFLAASKNIPVSLYSPNEVKAQVTGYGNAEKAQVTAMVTRILGLGAPPKPADAADALALAITHAWQLGRGGKGISAADRNAEQTRQSRLLHPARIASDNTIAQQMWRDAEKQFGAKRGKRKSS